jgi:hypothetical protein
VKLRQKLAFRKLSLLTLALFCVVQACSEKQSLSNSDLKIAAGDLRTLSLASGRMTEQFAKGDLTQIFYRNQSELLFEKVNDTAKQLEGSGEQPEHENNRRRLSDVAARLQTELEKTQRGETPATQYLNELGYEARDIEDSLKEK